MKNQMINLINALQIFLKYGSHPYPTHCEHDVLLIPHYKIDEISTQDVSELKQLGFQWLPEHDCFGSYRFGSA